jgi:hypothetical protein
LEKEVKVVQQVFGAIAAVGILAAATPAYAAVVFEGQANSTENGQLVKAKATFTVVGNTITVVLENISGSATLANGSVITGVIFDIEPDIVPNSDLVFTASNNPVRTNGSDIYVDGGTGGGNDRTATINNSLNLGGSYTSNLTASGLGDFGVATTGTLFGANGIGLGGGAADYGLVAAGTYTDGGSAVGTPQSMPFVQTSVTFTFTYTDSNTGAGHPRQLLESNIVGANFMVGTGGQSFLGLETSQSDTTLPEPVSLAIWGLGLGLAGIAPLHRRMRRTV